MRIAVMEPRGSVMRWVVWRSMRVVVWVGWSVRVGRVCDGREGGGVCDDREGGGVGGEVCDGVLYHILERRKGQPWLLLR